MPVFVHLAPEKYSSAIRRGGIALIKRRFRPRGVYAMPVTRNFQVSHQWLRELKRHGGGTIVGVYFRIPDDEVVEVGHYNSLHLSMTAAHATALLFEAERRNPVEARKKDQRSKRVRRQEAMPISPEGFEVI